MKIPEDLIRLVTVRRAWLIRTTHIVGYLAVALLGVAAVVSGLDWYLGKYAFVPTRVMNCLMTLSAKTTVLRPTCDGAIFHPDFGRVPYRTNTLGMRDQNYDETVYQPGGPRKRVLVVGDSFTFGVGVGADETYHSILERRHPEFVFLNAGYPTLGIEEEAEVIDHFLARTNPNLVLVGVEANDLIQLPVDTQGSGDARKRLKVLAPVAQFLADYVLPQRVILAARGVLSSEWTRVYRTQLDPALEERYSRFVDAVAKIDESLEHHDPPVPLGVLLIPQVEQVNGFLEGRAGLSPLAPSDHLKARLSKEGIPVLDSIPFFETRRASDLFFPRDRHLTKHGHEVLADFVEQNLGTLVALMTNSGENLT